MILQVPAKVEREASLAAFGSLVHKGFPPMAGKLYVVARQIGNLEDMPPRGVRVLREADLIAAEDTRHTGHLLTRFEIRKPLVSYHQFSEAKRTAEFLRHFEQGQSIALVSDAGLPGVSDPGERVIRAAVAAGVPVEIV